MSEEKIAYSISQKKLSLKTIVENCTYDVYQYLSNVKKLLTTSDTVISFFNFNSLCLRICHSIWKTALLLNVQVAQQNMMIHKIAQNWTKTRQVTLFCAWIALQVEPPF